MIKKLDKTFIKFALVGIINTLVGTSIMYLSYNLLNFGYWLSSFLNYFLTSILSYFLNRNFTFKSKEKHAKAILKFAVNILICYALAYGVAKPITKFFLQGYSIQTQDNIAMAVGMVIFVLLNYLGQKLLVFRK
ncbi:GtrA family protein [Lagierella sp.]|uniref:GtrA family protein n=1 Tax=Lagierella sp. TaxID=2849657 RepID=UPI0026282F99|nr:GtrA family protein [Lagierella sp.]